MVCLSTDNAVDPHNQVADIKTSVANQLTAEDPSLVVRTTEYFNNTFAPDMVLDWPGSGQKARQLFLRTNLDWRILMEDLQWVSDQRPIVMPLGQLTEAPDPEDQELQEASRAAATLIAPRSSVAALGEHQGPEQLSHLLVTSVLRGGRGLMDESRAARTVTRVDSAYQAAQQAEPAAVVDAVYELERLVDVQNSSVLTRFLQAVWV